MAVYTAIDDPSAYFKVQLYTGNGSANHAITFDDTDTDMQPDMVWIKNRDATDNNIIFDSVRGATKRLYVDTTAVEATDADTLDSFTSDGFQVDADVKVNTNTEAYVAWCWKANGTGSANTAGSINTAATSANTTSGFSICTVADIGSEDFTFGHGLGVAPSWVLAKSRDGGKWNNYFKSLGAGYTIQSNTAAAKITNDVMWQDTDPSSTLVSSNGDQLDSNESYVFYCFADVQGFSKFGSYTGNGNADGAFVYTGFRPAFVIQKRTDTTGNWVMTDTGRSPDNESHETLYPNLTNAEEGMGKDLLSNGFKCKTSDATINASGGTYIYMAFAEAPFVNSNGVPCNAR